MRICIISNCQARPLGALLSAMRPDDRVSSYAAHDLMLDTQKREQSKIDLDAADIVLYVPISDAYEVEHIRLGVIQSSNKEKISIPGFYFRGLQPEWIYIGVANKRVQSAISDYHNEIVLDGFLAGLSVQETVANMFSEAYYESKNYFNVFDESAAEIQRRDSLCDVKAWPIIERIVKIQPTFFTINHPTNRVLHDMLVKVLQLINLPFFKLDPCFVRMDLSDGPITPPSLMIARRHQLEYGGCPLVRAPGMHSPFIKPNVFVARCYEIYETNRDALIKRS